MRRWFSCLLAACLVAACGAEDDPATAARGEKLVTSPALSRSAFNQLACSDCHAVQEDDERILAGYPLLGAASRPSYWGGGMVDLKEAVDFCLVYFMKGDKLDGASDDGRAVYQWLRAVADRGPTEALPLTIVARIEEAPPRGDPARGAEVHQLACAGCHGDASTGAGRLVPAAPILPEQAVAEALDYFPDYPPEVVFTEKIRHGQFFGVGGTMPLYALETLSDEDLGALLAFYGL